MDKSWRHPTHGYADGTLGALRELTADLPDETPIELAIRKAHDPDHFYVGVRVNGESVDLGNGVVVLEAEEPRDYGE